jgi:hypothetical protein
LEVYEGLRQLALSTKPGAMGVNAIEDQPAAYGVLLDMARENGTATLVGWSSGEASLYTSTGGGVLGTGLSSQAVRDAACAWVRSAQEHLSAFEPTTSFPTPTAVGTISLYVLTTNGIVAAYGAEADMSARTHRMSAVWVGAQVLIDRMRREMAAAESRGTVETLRRTPA